MGGGNEIIVGITHPYSTGKPDSLVFVVLKEARKLLDVKKGEPWHLKVDLQRKRIIYEPVKLPEVGEKLAEKRVHHD